MSKFKVKEGLNLPDGTNSTQGDVKMDATSGLQFYHNSANRTAVDTDSTQTLTNKTLTSPTVTGATLTLTDSNFTIQDNGDATKQVKFEASGVSAGQTRTLTVPDASTTLVGTDTTQTLSNKTLASPVVTTKIGIPDGSASVPSLASASDAATGFWFSGQQFLYQAGSSANTPWSVDNNGMNLHNQKRLRLYDFGGSLQTIDITAPTTISASYSLTMPTAQGAASSLLVNNGSGALSFATLVNANVSSSAAINFSKMEALTASRVAITDGSGVVSAANTATYPSLTELAYVKGVTSAIQTQLDSKTGITAVTASKTTTYTATTSDDVIPVDASGGAWTLTLYAASGNSGRRLTIKKTDTSTNAVTIDANSSETIDGNLTWKLVGQYDFLRLICDGSNWHIENGKTTSEVILDSGNGHGATATKIRRFTNARKNIGSGITYADDANSGGTFTINEAGVYSISWNDKRGGGADFMVITVNDTATTTNGSTPLTYAQGARAMTNMRTGESEFVGWTGRLEKNDVVRAHSNGALDATDTFCMFSITKVSP